MAVWYSHVEKKDLTPYGAIMALRNKDTKRVDLDYSEFIQFTNDQWGLGDFDLHLIETKLIKEFGIFLIAIPQEEKAVLLVL